MRALMIDLSTLNPRQREAVTHESGPLLVLAGAGSGKTRVITYRIAWLVAEARVPADAVMAVTFTNKAANEMLERAARIVPFAGGRPTIGTFHSTAVRFLRRWADRLGYTSRFVIYDTADQLALVKRSLRELGFDEDRFTPRSVLSRISNAKNELQGPDEFAGRATDFFGSKIAEAYRVYQKGLRTFDAMDFDDLIGNWVRLLREHPDVRELHLQRYKHLLIDEYQDTNHAQYALAKLLTGEEGNVVAVGDEDQSIYRFRGANIDNILNFERDFPGATVVKLEQNYRSTGNILDAAIGVVSNNVARKGKTLFTDGGRGEPVRVVSCETEREEARYVVGEIARLRGEVPLQECAVLFRTNAQSRPFEEELLERNMPYTVVGGVRFYDRAEVKDVLAYLRLIVRPHDTPSLERIINTPSRGIGDATWKAIESEAEEKDLSVTDVIDGELAFLAERARKAVREFRETIDDLRRAADKPLPDLIDYVVLRTGYRKALLASRDPQDEARLENIGELVSSAREFVETRETGSIADYLDTITLMADVDSYDGEKGLTLMTLHAAKGLEFKVVFLAGMEEGILPHGQAVNDYGDIEEERRLCYVGMTRARERLYCLHCFQRRLYGQTREQTPSQFIDEIPAEVREDVRLGSAGNLRGSYGTARMPYRDKPSYRAPSSPQARGGAANGRTGPGSAGNVMNFFQDAPVRFDPNAIRAAKEAEPSGATFRRGTRVRHAQFGVGVILQIEGKGDKEKLTIFFDRAGKKTLLTKIAKLEKA
jgi:DNA helicase II / ATP-dependent DNA helicase PcrA